MGNVARTAGVVGDQAGRLLLRGSGQRSQNALPRHVDEVLRKRVLRGQPHDGS